MEESKTIENYTKYRWFFTSSGKLVVGGKNAQQNEELINKLKTNAKYVVMHTKSPGSPFSIILHPNPSKTDMDETAVFTGSFSREWRTGKKATLVDIFLMEQIIKKPNMKIGTFGVIDSIDHRPVDLRLYLTKQKGILRAVPFEVKNTISIVPGKVKKEDFAEQIAVKMDIPVKEVIEAIPTGTSDFFISIKTTKKKTVKKNK